MFKCSAGGQLWSRKWFEWKWPNFRRRPAQTSRSTRRSNRLRWLQTAFVGWAWSSGETVLLKTDCLTLEGTHQRLANAWQTCPKARKFLPNVGKEERANWKMYTLKRALWMWILPPQGWRERIFSFQFLADELPREFFAHSIRRIRQALWCSKTEPHAKFNLGQTEKKKKQNKNSPGHRISDGNCINAISLQRAKLRGKSDLTEWLLQ